VIRQINFREPIAPNGFAAALFASALAPAEPPSGGSYRRLGCHPAGIISIPPFDVAESGIACQFLVESREQLGVPRLAWSEDAVDERPAIFCVQYEAVS